MTAAEVREVLDYDPKTGEFRWKVWRSGNAKAGQLAGGLNAEGYRVMMIDKVSYKASRLAFLMMTGKWPTGFVDHRDLDRANNKWENLRQATPLENGQNKPKYANNSTGHKGVYRHTDGRYRVRIRVKGRLHSVGLFSDIQDAASAYAGASARFHGEFGRSA